MSCGGSCTIMTMLITSSSSSSSSRRRRRSSSSSSSSSVSSSSSSSRILCVLKLFGNLRFFEGVERLARLHWQRWRGSSYWHRYSSSAAHGGPIFQCFQHVSAAHVRGPKAFIPEHRTTEAHYCYCCIVTIAALTGRTFSIMCIDRFNTALFLENALSWLGGRGAVTVWPWPPSKRPHWSAETRSNSNGNGMRMNNHEPINAKIKYRGYLQKLGEKACDHGKTSLWVLLPPALPGRDLHSPAQCFRSPWSRSGEKLSLQSRLRRKIM